jgi:hypothetical protein
MYAIVFSLLNVFKIVILKTHRMLFKVDYKNILM